MVGVLLSKIRSNYSWIRGGSKLSGGVIPFVKIINDTALAINQEGKRSGAVTTALHIWHLDIEEFLEMQRETGGDIRRKCFDVFPQVLVHNEFMRRVKEDREWVLIDPYEVRVKYNVELADLYGESFTNFYLKLLEELEGNSSTPNLESKGLTLWKKVSAKELYKSIMKCKIESGLPYEAYIDTINQYNPNKKEGSISLVNLCCESFSTTKSEQYDHVCNLLSIVASNIDKKDLEEISELAQRMLDNTIELTNPPTEHSAAHNKRYRTIGIGTMGLHDYLAKNNLNYLTGKEEVSKFFEYLAYNTFKSNIQLAKEKGSFEAFENSELAKGIVLGKIFYKNQYILAEELRQFYSEKELVDIIKSEDKLAYLFKDSEFQVFNSHYNWDEIREGVQRGCRNSQLLAIAPNTTTALIQGVTASVLPVFSKFYMEKTSKGTTVNCPPYLEEKFWYYTENKNIDQAVVIDIASEIQKWTDTGISLELLFDLNKEEVNAKYIYERQMLAWEKGIKALYYIRFVDQQKDPNKECSSCAG